MATSVQPIPAPPSLRRALGFWEVTASGVGIIVGAGIYVIVGEATADAGNTVWLGFVLAAVLSALSGLSYAELAGMFPRASAEYEYTSHAYPGWVAFLTGWVMIAGLVVAGATISLGFARYLREFFDVPEKVGALVLLASVGIITLGGIKNSTRLTVVLTVVQVGGLLLVITTGFTHIGNETLLAGKGAGGVLSAAALVFFAFIGFDEVITLSEETHNPSRTIPRALLAALFISTLLYVAVAVVAVSVIGGEALGASSRPLADVMSVAVGGYSVGLVAAFALASTANAALLVITASSRLTYGMAVSGALPRWLSHVYGRTGAPTYALATSIVVAALFALFGRLSLIASVTDFAVYLVFLAVNGAVITLRLRNPQHERPFRIPWSIGRVPVLPILGLASTLLMMTQLESRSVVIGLAVVAVGAMVTTVYTAWQRASRRTARA